MKKVFFMAFAVIAAVFSSCGSDGDTTEVPTTEKEVQHILHVLNGKFHGERKSTIGNITENEDIEFQPFDKPKEIVSLFGTFTAHGIALACDYINNNAPFTTYRKYYSVKSNSTKEKFTISFYQCNNGGEVVNKEDKRTIEVQNTTLFYMRPYGTSVENNKKYTKK